METVIDTALAERILQSTGENVFLCYQCVKCTSGCMLTEYFDLGPNQIMRATQLGKVDLINDSLTPWLCAGCQTCTTRCPQGIDVARVMDFIVNEALEQGVKPKVPEVALFNKVFLRDANLLGRTYELGLAAEMNLRTGQPLKDLDIAFGMLKKGKLGLLPKIVWNKKPPTSVEIPARSDNEVGYYPGCSLHSTAKEYDLSTRTTLKELDIVPVEPEGWICCGSTPAHRTDHQAAVRMPAANLVNLEQQGLNEVVLPCAACFNRFRVADHELKQDPELKDNLEDEFGVSISAGLEIHSLLQFLVNKIGLDKIAERVVRPLEGLNVACYYGCLLTRPPEVTGAKDPEYPMEMDRIVEALGATPVDWDFKVACCGASLTIPRTDIVLEMSAKIIDNARARGADLLAVACPLCHTNIDGRQSQMQGLEPFPTVFITQLMALAFDKSKDAALERNMIDPRPLLKEIGLIGSSPQEL